MEKQHVAASGQGFTRKLLELEYPKGQPGVDLHCKKTMQTRVGRRQKRPQVLKRNNKVFSSVIYCHFCLMKFIQFCFNLFTHLFINLSSSHIRFGYQVDLSFVESISYFLTYLFINHDLIVTFNPLIYQPINQSSQQFIHLFVNHFFVIYTSIHKTSKILNFLSIIYLFYNIFM